MNTYPDPVKLLFYICMHRNAEDVICILLIVGVSINMIKDGTDEQCMADVV